MGYAEFMATKLKEDKKKGKVVMKKKVVMKTIEDIQDILGACIDDLETVRRRL